jgi:hypothetical protein
MIEIQKAEANRWTMDADLRQGAHTPGAAHLLVLIAVGGIARRNLRRSGRPRHRLSYLRAQSYIIKTEIKRSVESHPRIGFGDVVVHH